MVNLQELLFYKALTHKVDEPETSGDMTKEVFDPTSEVETGGGIPEYVKGNSGIFFTITLTESSDGTYSADKTYSEIKAAYDSHKAIAVLLDSTAMLNLMNAEFSSDGSAGFTFGYTQAMADGSLVFTRGIHYLHTSDLDLWEDADSELDVTLYEPRKVWKELITNTLTSAANYIEFQFPQGYDEYIVEIYTPMPDESSNAIIYPYSSYSNNGTKTNIVLPQWLYQSGMKAQWLTLKFDTLYLGDELHLQMESIERTAANNNDHNPQQSGEVLKSQYFNTDSGRQLLGWDSLRYERKCVAGTTYKLFGRK